MLRLAPLLTSCTDSFLCNTSGSGKTRLLFEGLWTNWGFYITASNQPEEIGSSDLFELLQSLEGTLEELKNVGDVETLRHNQEKVSRAALILLFSRMVIFRIFLECASSEPTGITEEHKGLWLLLQIAPQKLLGFDLFHQLVQIYGNPPTSDRKATF
jgi:hypothetical protein